MVLDIYGEWLLSVHRLNSYLANVAQPSSSESHNKPQEAEYGVQLLPPDGGWGWAIICANVIILFCAQTLPVCFASIYMLILLEEKASNATLSGIIALFLIIANVLVPFSACLSKYYSHRRIALVGILLMFLGLSLCSISLKIPWLYFCYGFIGGIGFALTKPHSFLLSQSYFLRRRVMANALSMVGFSMGFAFMPIIVYKLMVFYSVRGGFLIWSSILFNGAIGAMLYQPVKWHLKPTKVLVTSKTPERGSAPDFKKVVSRNVTDEEVMDTEHLKQEGRGKDAFYDTILNEDGESFYNCHLDNKEDRGYKVFGSDLFLDVRETSGIRPLSFISSKSVDSFVTIKTQYKSIEKMSVNTDFYDVGSTYSLGTISGYQGMLNGDLPSKDLETEDFSENEDNETDGEVGNTPPQKASKPYLICGVKIPRISEAISLKLLTNSLFLIAAIACCANRQVNASFVIYLPVVTSQFGQVVCSYYLIMLLAGMEIASMLLVAYISNKKWINRRYLYMVGAGINCIALIGSVLSTALVHLAVSTAVLGMGMGIVNSIGPVLMVEYIAAELLPQTFGLQLLMDGVVSLVFFPIQGWTIDHTGSSLALCILLLILSVIPLLSWSLAPFFSKGTEKK